MRKVFIALLFILVVVSTILYFHGSVIVYDSYVNNYLVKNFEKALPHLELKISDSKVDGSNDMGEYRVILSGILVKEKSNNRLVGKIPRIKAIISSGYFFTNFKITELIVQDPKIFVFPKSVGINLDKIIGSFSEYVTHARINNLIIKGTKFNSVYLQSISKYSWRTVNANIKKDDKTSVQLEAKVSSNVVLSSRFNNLNLSDIGLNSDYNINISGHSNITFRNNKISKGWVKVEDVSGTITGETEVVTVISGGGGVRMQQNKAIVDDMNLVVKDRDRYLSIFGEYLFKNKELDVTLKISSLNHKELLNYWPKNIGESAKEWVESYVADGVLFEPQLQISGSLENSFRANVEADFKDLKLIFNEISVPVTNSRGHLSIRDDILNVRFDYANINGIELSEGSVTQDSMQSKAPIIVQGNVSSKVKPFSMFLEKGGKLQEIISNINGFAYGDFYLIIDNGIRRKVNMSLLDISYNKFFNLFDFHDGVFDLNIDGDYLKLTGNVIIGDEVLKIVAEGDKEMIVSNIQGGFPAKSLVLSEIFGEKTISGNIKVDINSRYVDGYNYVEGELDLVDSIFNIHLINWQSSFGDDALIKFYAVQNDSSFLVPEFSIVSSKTEVKGFMSIESEELKELVFIEQSATNNVQFNYKKQNNIQKIIAKGDKLFLDSLENKDLNTKNFKDNFDIAAEFKEIVLNNEFSIYDMSLKVNPEYKDSYFIGKFTEDSGFIMENTAKGFTIESNDAGLLLSTFGVVNELNKGMFLLRFVDGKGSIIINNFFLIRAPLLAQILSLASLQGIVSTLNSEGIFFDQLQAPFTYESGIINFSESWLEGLSLGVSFEGEVGISDKKLDLSGYVVPVYYINKFIWNIPVVGELVTGGLGRGVISIDYKLKTQDDGNNKVSVNIISIFTPKVLQKLLEMFG